METDREKKTERPIDRQTDKTGRKRERTYRNDPAGGGHGHTVELDRGHLIPVLSEIKKNICI